MLTADLLATRRVKIDGKPRGRGGGSTSRYRKDSVTRVEGYEDGVDGGDGDREVENPRSSGIPLESLFAALEGQYFESIRHF